MNWIFISLQDDRPHRGQKRWFLHLSNLLLLPRWFLPLQTPSLPGDTPDGGQKSIYSFIYWNQLPSFSNFPPRLLSFLTLSLRDDSRAEAKNSSAAMLYWKWSPRNKAPAQTWLDIYHQYISNKVCNQYILWTRNLNRHSEIIQLMHRFV